MKTKIKTEQRDRRRKRIRARISGTSEKPRLSVFKSNKYLSAQLIDDERRVTLVAINTKNIKGKTLLSKSKEAGALLAKAALGKKISTVVFDRGGYIYTGSVQAIAEGAREAGLKF